MENEETSTEELTPQVEEMPKKRRRRKKKVQDEQETTKEPSGETREDTEELDSTTVHSDDGKKARFTFLVGQSFRGQYYKEGESIIVSAGVAKRYQKRTSIRISAV